MLSIRQRLTLWYTLVLMFVMVAFAAVIFVGGAWQLERTTDRELQQTTRQLTGPLLRGEDLLVVDTSYRLLTMDGRVGPLGRVTGATRSGGSGCAERGAAGTTLVRDGANPADSTEGVAA